MTTLSDKKLYDTEIQSFVKTVKTLDTQNCFTEPLSEAKLILWIEINKEQLLYLNKTPEVGKWHKVCLEALEEVENKPQILQAMIEIAKSDDEFHFSEKALVILTARHWNIAIEDTKQFVGP